MSVTLLIISTRFNIHFVLFCLYFLTFVSNVNCPCLWWSWFQVFDLKSDCDTLGQHTFQLDSCWDQSERRLQRSWKKQHWQSILNSVDKSVSFNAWKADKLGQTGRNLANNTDKSFNLKNRTLNPTDSLFFQSMAFFFGLKRSLSTKSTFFLQFSQKSNRSWINTTIFVRDFDVGWPLNRFDDTRLSSQRLWLCPRSWQGSWASVLSATIKKPPPLGSGGNPKRDLESRKVINPFSLISPSSHNFRAG